MLMSFIDVEPWEASVLEKAQEEKCIDNQNINVYLLKIGHFDFECCCSIMEGKLSVKSEETWSGVGIIF